MDVEAQKQRRRMDPLHKEPKVSFQVPLKNCHLPVCLSLLSGSSTVQSAAVLQDLAKNDRHMNSRAMHCSAEH